MRLSNFFWTNEPKETMITNDIVEFITEPKTDLWQKTYYGFSHDNAPLLQMKTEELMFSFSVKVTLNYEKRFDQAGICLYLDASNWIKASIELDKEKVGALGTVVTNHDYSDWSMSEIQLDFKEIWFRLSRRNNDFLVETSLDGVQYKEMRITHLEEASNFVYVGVYAASPLDSSFAAHFSAFSFTKCLWETYKE